MGNAPSLPGPGGGRAHGMRYDDPGGSPKGQRPEGIPAVAMETRTAEQIEEESISGDSEVEVLEPLEGHTYLGLRALSVGSLQVNHSQLTDNALAATDQLFVATCRLTMKR